MQAKINKIKTPQLKKWGLLVIPLKRLEGRTTPFALNVASADSSARVAWRAISEWLEACHSHLKKNEPSQSCGQG